jgi:alpha-tubulin suppressor-like RCC1 family protein
VFKKIQLDVIPMSENHVYIGHDHVIVISEDSKVYGWGCYVRESEEKSVYKGSHIPFFDDY